MESNRARVYKGVGALESVAGMVERLIGNREKKRTRPGRSYRTRMEGVRRKAHPIPRQRMRPVLRMYHEVYGWRYRDV